jgi:membrane protein implicated in regulation of membrane protease activity
LETKTNSGLMKCMKIIETLFQSTQTVVFLTIALIGFVFLLFTSLFGGDHDHDHDMDHDHDHDIGGAHEFSTVSFFSPKILCIFLVAFGAAGTIASAYGLRPLWSTLIGFGSGLVIGFAALMGLRLLYSQQVNSLVTNEGIVGKVGRVITRIPQHGIGEITFVMSQQSITRLARSYSGAEIPVGRAVKILSASGDALEVESV